MTRQLRTLMAAVAAVSVLAAPTLGFAAPADDMKEADRLYKQGKLQPALEKIDGALKGAPKDAQGRFTRGLILTEMKRVDEAIAVFTGLTEDFPDLAEPYNNLAVLYAGKGSMDKARAALELAIHTHPTYATAHENLGDIYGQLAARAYDKALSLDKGNASTMAKLSIVKELFTARSGPIKAAAAPPPPVVAPPPPTRAPAPPAPSPSPAAAVAQTAAQTAAPTVVTAAVGTPSAAASQVGNEINAMLVSWAKAWSAKDADSYLSFYAPDFEAGAARATWEQGRRDRIAAPKNIDVKVALQSISPLGSEATVQFKQSYRSNITNSDSTKTMRLVKMGERWLIKSEKSG